MYRSQMLLKNITAAIIKPHNKRDLKLLLNSNIHSMKVMGGVQKSKRYFKFCNINKKLM
jgi:hypothetical protein